MSVGGVPKAGVMRRPERRVIAVLRAWAAGPAMLDVLWDELCGTIGESRARSCLIAFFELRSLLDHHAWRMPVLLQEGAEGYSEDELAIARFVMAAAEQRREVALAEAEFLVSPLAFLPLLQAAARFGLPLLCEDCRARVLGRPLRRKRALDA
ncbi:hypothetical protein [Citreimonas salinaria]|uniref:Uncharacterized protein n=1 Tax=Citreimonas salinaria TaxID=321339 RepID=A0A1H3L2U7_9RHOB|nr:hypothetical protein [Citreimonas salinaria]SDY58743.1 hypothetical protein SAMN05444340_11157 [Citreimonas salinaria]